MRVLRTTFAVAAFLTALIATVVFKIALFGYSASGAEGAASALLTWPRIALCLGWDVMSAVKNGGIVTVQDTEVTRPGPRLPIGLRNLAAAIRPDVKLPTAP